MLMLTRQPGKSIIIGGNIRVVVAGVTGQQVRLGIVAPAGVVVDREEIHQLRVAEGTAQESAFSIDEHLKLIADDARRYRHLRNRECIEDASEDLLVLRGDTYFTGEELDCEIDAALRLETLEQQVVQEQHP